jgi:glycosyltransferase involved in cell wall biosynthesis
MNPISSKKVSVIIPCYNYAHYLGECIESVLKQTYPVHEIIVINDEGKDNAEEVASKYPVKYVWQKNKGLAGARNTGISMATGDYIMCLDADDKLVPAAIEEHVKLITDDMTIAQCALLEFGERHVLNIPNPSTSLERIMQSNTIYCNAMFPRKAWVEVEGFDESETMRLGYEDWEFWIRCLAKGYKVNTSDFIALRYRVHEGQMTQATSHPNRQKLYKYIYDKHKDLYESKNLIVAGLII